jgi:hypothetical protein
MLIDEAMVDFALIEKKREPDGEGGFVVSWTEGATFQAAVVLDSSTVAKIAEKQGVSNLYTVTVRKNVALDFHDIIKRLSDGKVLRITSNSEDKQTPGSAFLDMRQYSAEEWELTS